MNLLTCNMRPNFVPGMPSRNVSQKRQFHHASAPSLENLIQSNSPDKYFQNPNIFHRHNFEKSVPSSYNHTNLSLDKVQEKNSLNSCVLILEEAKQIDSDRTVIKESSKLPVEETIFQNNTKLESENLKNKMSPFDIETYKTILVEEMSCSDSDKMLIEESAKSLLETICKPLSEVPEEATTHMEIDKTSSDDEMSCSDSEDDSFIVFDCAGPSIDKRCSRQSPVIEFIEEESSSDEDDDDNDWGKNTVVFHNSNRNRDRQSSCCESEDSFIVFGDGDHEEESDEQESKCDGTFIVFGEEDSEEEFDDKVKKPDNGKKVSFAEGPELCTVHLMVKWSFAYQKARKGLWEQFARDNARFKYRADIFGMELNKFLQPEHRRKVYEERFKDKQE